MNNHAFIPSYYDCNPFQYYGECRFSYYRENWPGIRILSNWTLSTVWSLPITLRIGWNKFGNSRESNVQLFEIYMSDCEFRIYVLGEDGPAYIHSKHGNVVLNEIYLPIGIYQLSPGNRIGVIHGNGMLFFEFAPA